MLAHVHVITQKGSTFASRVAFSLLYACGLQTLAVDSVERYEALAVDFGLHPYKAADLKLTLARRPLDNSMFAPQRFCRQLEGAYLQMFDRLRKGGRPAPLRISTAQSA
jgi:protein O-GlcNAc transferase